MKHTRNNIEYGQLPKVSIVSKLFPKFLFDMISPDKDWSRSTPRYFTEYRLVCSQKIPCLAVELTVIIGAEMNRFGLTQV